jgi:hypothetical protein
MTGEEKALYQQIQNLERDLAHSRRETDDHRVQLSVKEEEDLPFAKCDFCIQHRARAERKRTQDDVDQDNAALRMHLEDIKAEKLMYYSNRPITMSIIEAMELDREQEGQQQQGGQQEQGGHWQEQEYDAAYDAAYNAAYDANYEAMYKPGGSMYDNYCYE